jgi:hypothetical protein
MPAETSSETQVICLVDVPHNYFNMQLINVTNEVVQNDLRDEQEPILSPVT